MKSELHEILSLPSRDLAFLAAMARAIEPARIVCRQLPARTAEQTRTARENFAQSFGLEAAEPPNRRTRPISLRRNAVGYLHFALSCRADPPARKSLLASRAAPTATPAGSPPSIGAPRWRRSTRRAMRGVHRTHVWVDETRLQPGLRAHRIRTRRHGRAAHDRGRQRRRSSDAARHGGPVHRRHRPRHRQWRRRQQDRHVSEGAGRATTTMCRSMWRCRRRPSTGRWQRAPPSPSRSARRTRSPR